MSEIINGANMNKSGVYPGWKPMAQAEHDKITIEPLTVTENDTYTAPAGKAYSPVTVNVAGGGGLDSLLTLHLSFEMPELPEGTSSLLLNTNMIDFEGSIVKVEKSNTATSLFVTEAQEDLKVYNIPLLTMATDPPDPTYTTVNEVYVWLEGNSGLGPWFDAENSIYTNCSWNDDTWMIDFDEGFTEASIKVKFTNVKPL